MSDLCKDQQISTVLERKKHRYICHICRFLHLWPSFLWIYRQCLYELIWKRTVDLRAKTNDRKRQTRSDCPLIWHCISVNCHTSRWILCLNMLLLLPHTHCICICICPTINLYFWETRTVHSPNFVFASHSGMCPISRWKHSWDKLFGYLRSTLHLVSGCRNLIIWAVICICDKLNLSAHWAVLGLYLHLSPSLSRIKM